MYILSNHCVWEKFPFSFSFLLPYIRRFNVYELWLYDIFIVLPVLWTTWYWALMYCIVYCITGWPELWELQCLCWDRKLFISNSLYFYAVFVQFPKISNLDCRWIIFCKTCREKLKTWTTCCINSKMRFFTDEKF